MLKKDKTYNNKYYDYDNDNDNGNKKDGAVGKERGEEKQGG